MNCFSPSSLMSYLQFVIRTLQTCKTRFLEWDSVGSNSKLEEFRVFLLQRAAMMKCYSYNDLFIPSHVQSQMTSKSEQNKGRRL